MAGEVAELVAQVVGKSHAAADGSEARSVGSLGPLGCCFYGWVIVAVCIFCKIFKVQGREGEVFWVLLCRVEKASGRQKTPVRSCN